MWTVQCDTPGCGNLFYPNGDVNNIFAVRDMAEAAGWTGRMDRFPPSDQRPPDLCPTCTKRAQPKE